MKLTALEKICLTGLAIMVLCFLIFALVPTVYNMPLEYRQYVVVMLGVGLLMAFSPIVLQKN